MDFNLCTEPWLTFKTRDGGRCRVSLGDLGREDLVDIAMPRPDFYGAAWQFLIGILQTAFAPVDDDEWIERYESPPSSEEIKTALSRIEHAFELFGEGPCFMQDYSLLDKAGEVGVSSLLIDAPGGNALKLNTDHFVKRGQVERLSPSMAAMALFTLQVNAPAGGQGNRTGLRGGGPLTSLVVHNEPSQTLFRKLWLNVIPASGDLKVPDDYDAAVFPWLGPAKTSEKPGSEVYMNDEGVHSLQQYWAMPRRIRLIPGAEGICDLTGEEATTTVAAYRAKNRGINYKGTWSHPLTPYRYDRKKPDQAHFSIKGQPGGIGYRQWHQFLFRDEENGSIPAQVVAELGKKQFWLGELGLQDQLGVWVYGFDMDNMKARAWYEAKLPFLTIATDKTALFVQEVVQHLDVANQMRLALRHACKQAWLGENGESRGDLGFIDEQFWADTEPAFFEMVGSLRSAIEVGEQLLPKQACEAWIKRLRQSAVGLFDALVLSAQDEDRHLARKLDARRRIVNKRPAKAYTKKHGIEPTGVAKA